LEAILGEFELIARYFTRPVTRARLGVGDDCALLRVAAGMELAVSSDMLVEGRHFLPSVNPAHLGHKALAVNLSDLAACGAQPLAFTLALALPAVDAPWLEGFARGMLALADAHGIELVGGDTTKSVLPLRGLNGTPELFANGALQVAPGPVCICITVFGEVPPGAALLRSGAQVGDRIWVSGHLGDARLALGQRLGEWLLLPEHLQATTPRMDTPTPRVALGLALRGVATAAIDVSDGLVGDLQHILQRSGGLGALLHTHLLPRSASLAAQPAALQLQCLLAGGDDYELVFTAPASATAAIDALAQSLALPLTAIGVVEQQAGVRFADAAGRSVAPLFAGFDHFAA
jgi:thiamine-monophosphate kinase